MNIRKFIRDVLTESIIGYGNIVYYGCNRHLAYGIQKGGGITPGNLTLTEDLQKAKYISFVKSGKQKGIVLRTKLVINKFVPSKKYENDWVSIQKIPVSDIDVLTENGWVPFEGYEVFTKGYKSPRLTT